MSISVTTFVPVLADIGGIALCPRRSSERGAARARHHNEPALWLWFGCGDHRRAGNQVRRGGVDRCGLCRKHVARRPFPLLGARITGTAGVETRREISFHDVYRYGAGHRRCAGSSVIRSVSMPSTSARADAAAVRGGPLGYLHQK